MLAGVERFQSQGAAREPPMRLPRFRLRTLMIAVAVVALLVWCAMMGVRSYDYYRRATIYGANERGWRYMAVRDRGDPARARSVSAIWGLQIADYYAPLA